MTPEHAIENSAELMKRINQFCHSLSLEMDENSEQWDALGRIGCQRADHAAQLLGRLRPILHDLGEFCGNVEKQIDGMIADPFGRNGKE